MQRSFAPDNDQTRVDIWTRSMIEGGYRPRWAPQAAPFSPVRPSETGYDLRGTSSPVTAMMPSSPPMGGGISGPWQQQQQQQQWVSPNDAKPQRTKSAGIWSKVKNVFGSNKGGQATNTAPVHDRTSQQPSHPEANASVEEIWQMQQQQAVQSNWYNHQQSAMHQPQPLPSQAGGDWYQQLQAGIHHQYMLSAPVVVPAPVIMDMMAQVQRSNELLRRESQARSQGMRTLVEAVNRNLAVTNQLSAAMHGGNVKGMVLGGGIQMQPDLHQLLVAQDIGGPKQDQRPQMMGLGAELERMKKHPPSSSVGFWQAPAPPSSLVKSTGSLPGAKWDQAKDLRVATWNVQGLDYRGPEDQDAVAVVAQMLWACQADLVALVGLPSLRAVPKICALLSLWDQSNGTESWRYICSPPRSSIIQDTPYHPQEHFAFVWREPSVLPWAGSGLLKPKLVTPTTSAYSSYGSVKPTAVAAAETQPPGSFLLLEAGVKGSSAHLLSRDIFTGVFSVGHRPVMVAAVNLPPGSGSAAIGERRNVAPALQAACREIQGRHQGMSGQTWMVVAGTFNCKPCTDKSDCVLDPASWEHLLEDDIGTQVQGNQHCDNVVISKVVFGGSKVDRDDRILQPIAQSDGASGQYGDPPYRAGAAVLQQQLLKALPRTEHVLVWGEARVRPKPGVPQQSPQAPATSAKSPSAATTAPPPPVSRPQSYIEAVQSDIRKPSSPSTTGISPRVTPSSGSASSISRPITGSAGGYGLGSEIKKTTVTSTSGYGSDYPKKSTSPVSSTQSYGLDSDLKKSSSGGYGLGSDLAGKKPSSPAAVGGYGLDMDLRKSSSSSLAKKPIIEDDDDDVYGLFDDEMSKMTASTNAQRYGRVPTPDGPSTPRTGSPSGVPERPLSGGGGISRPLAGSGVGGMASKPLPSIGAGLSGPTLASKAASSVGKTYY